MLRFPIAEVTFKASKFDAFVLSTDFSILFCGAMDFLVAAALPHAGMGPLVAPETFDAAEAEEEVCSFETFAHVGVLAWLPVLEATEAVLMFESLNFVFVAAMMGSISSGRDESLSVVFL